jgi:iron complex outermembrane recepter protein
VLQSKPGITSSGFAPGAASRPVVRGLDNYRVRIQENGLGVNDVSDLSDDHAVPIDPLSARQVEVIRGPATLRYGSQAIGGVVNVDNNRIPTFISPRGFAGEVKGALTSVDSGAEGAALSMAADARVADRSLVKRQA